MPADAMPTSTSTQSGKKSRGAGMTKAFSISLENFSAWYGGFQALDDLSLEIPGETGDLLHRPQRLRQDARYSSGSTE
jgi:hypothetical protein